MSVILELRFGLCTHNVVSTFSPPSSPDCCRLFFSPEVHSRSTSSPCSSASAYKGHRSEQSFSFLFVVAKLAFGKMSRHRSCTQGVILAVLVAMMYIMAVVVCESVTPVQSETAQPSIDAYVAKVADAVLLNQESSQSAAPAAMVPNILLFVIVSGSLAQNRCG
jgi:hypothetical protein